MSEIVAALIVRDEEPVIRRCLDALRAAGIDTIVANDNGSEDSTPSILAEYGVIQVPGLWVNFAHNRNLVLEEARKHGDYVLCGLDADEVFTIPSNAQFKLTMDLYTVNVRYKDTRYFRRALVKSTAPFEWQHPIHELLMPTGPFTEGHLEGAWITVHSDGARSRNPKTQENDLIALKEACLDFPNEPRYVFYIAQTLKDLNKLAEASGYYRKRTHMGGYFEELWYSHYMVARIDDWHGHDPMSGYLRAYNINPYRGEPLYHAADWARRNQLPALAYALASAFRKLRPVGLFVEEDVYEWKMLDLIASTAWYADEKAEGKKAAYTLLMERNFPEEHRARIKVNAKIYGVE